MLSAKQYLEQVLTCINTPEPQPVHLEEALGAILAADAFARVPLPAFTNSAMDGFAVRAADTTAATKEDPATLKVIGDIPAGTDPALVPVPSEPNMCVRIMTGAAMPSWADAVVRVEDTNIPAGPVPLPSQIEIFTSVSAGANVRHQGEATAAGDLVAKAGTQISALVIAAAAATGTAKLPVFPKPRVGVVTTGSELVFPDAQLQPGQIPDSNSYMLAALCEEAGAQVTAVKRVEDTVEAFGAAAEELASGCDLLLSAGGVSAGAFDIVREYGEAHGFSFEAVAMQPGKPQGHGLVQGTPMITLPGNPVSVWVSFVLFVLPTLARLAGLGLPGSDSPAALLEENFEEAIATFCSKSHRGRQQFIPVTLQRTARGWEASLAHVLGSGSHVISSAHRADALLIIGQDINQVEAGEKYPFLRVNNR